MRVLLRSGDLALTRSVTAELLGAGHELSLLGGGPAFHAELPASVRTTGVDADDGRAADMLLATIRPDAVVLLPGPPVGVGRTRGVGASRRALAAHLGLVARLPDHGVRSLLVGSTLEVYADRSGRPQSETAPLRPTSPEATAALTLERAVTELGIGDDGNVGVLRCGRPFGVDVSFGAAPRATGGVLTGLLRSFDVGATAQPDGQEAASTDLGPYDRAGVTDLARGFRLGLTRLEVGPFVTNLSSGRRFDAVQLATWVAELTGRLVIPEPSDGPGGPAGDPTRAEQVLGWRAERGPADLVVDLVERLGLAPRAARTPTRP